MEQNTTHIRMCYRASDVVIVAQHNHADIWRLQHTYTHHQLWLQQVYRTLNENDQCTACIHVITVDVASGTWQTACDAALATRTSVAPWIGAHIVCIGADDTKLAETETWVRHAATDYAPSGQRINTMLLPTISNYVDYLLHRDAWFLSGAFFDTNGTLLRNGCSVSERTLANYWITHVSRHNVVHVS